MKLVRVRYQHYHYLNLLAGGEHFIAKGVTKNCEEQSLMSHTLWQTRLRLALRSIWLQMNQSKATILLDSTRRSRTPRQRGADS
jgi:hypothetical protein